MAVSRGLFSLRFRKWLCGGIVVGLVWGTANFFKQNEECPVSYPGEANCSLASVGLSNESIPTNLTNKQPLANIKNGCITVVGTLAPGENLAKFLHRNNVTKNDAAVVIKTLKNVTDLRKLRTGQGFTLHINWHNNLPLLSKLEMHGEFAESLILIRKQDTPCVFELSRNQYIVTKKDIRVHGTIYKNLGIDLVHKGVPYKISTQVLNLLNNKINCRSGISRGDRFSIIYEIHKVGESNRTRVGNVKYVCVSTKNKEIKLYGMNLGGHGYDFFDNNGVSVRRNFMSPPINGGRITSRFGTRVHPILGYSHKHKGLDIAARIGTPIYAVSDGRVKFMGRKFNYGRVVCIEHTGGYSTLYAHMNGFAKKLSIGSIVKQGQVIGFVGCSGLASGAHLHIEVLKNSVHLNPLRVGMLPQRRLSAKELVEFRKLKNKIEAEARQTDI